MKDLVFIYEDGSYEEFNADELPVRRDAEYDESKHPRDEAGRWTDTGGGFGPTQLRLNLPDDTPRITSEAFADRMASKGLRAVANIDDLPLHVRNELQVEGSADLPRAAADGVEEGLDILKEQSPGLYALLQDGVMIGNATYGGEADSMAVTSFSKEGTVSILVNGRTGLNWQEISDERPNVALQMAKGKTGEEAWREVYKGAIVHEVGHVANASMQGRFSESLTLELQDHFVGLTALIGDEQDLRGADERIHKFVYDKISPYAAYGGPEEAVAELFTKVVFKQRIPRELTRTAALMRKALTRPYAKP